MSEFEKKKNTRNDGNLSQERDDCQRGTPAKKVIP